MENKNLSVVLAGLLGIALVAFVAFAGLALRYAGQASEANSRLGIALTNSSASGSQELRNALSDLVKDATGATYSAAYDPVSMTSSTLNVSGHATTSITVAGAAVGDLVQVNFATTTSNDLWTVSGKVTAADTVLVTMVNLGNAALNLGSATLKVKVTSSTPLSTTSF